MKRFQNFSSQSKSNQDEEDEEDEKKDGDLDKINDEIDEREGGTTNAWDMFDHEKDDIEIAEQTPL